MFRLLAIPLALGLLALNVINYVAVAGISVDPRPVASTEAVAAARLQLTRKPLSADSYFVLGISADGQGRRAQGRLLVETALALNPRNRPARLWLLDDSARTGALDRAVAHADVLVRLSPETAPALSLLLGRLALQPSARNAIAIRFANRPFLLDIAAQSAQQGLDARGIAALMAHSDKEKMPGSAASLQAMVARPLLENDKIAEAREAWYAMGGYRPNTAVFDGEFRDNPGGAPFGWKLTRDAEVEAEMLRPAAGEAGRGLHVTTFGSLGARVAEQALALTPGTHELRFVAWSPDVVASRNAFAWSIRCQSGPLLVEAAVDTARGSQAEQRYKLVVPPRCLLQSLTLAKLGTENQQNRTLVVSRIAVDGN